MWSSMLKYSANTTLSTPCEKQFIRKIPWIYKHDNSGHIFNDCVFVKGLLNTFPWSLLVYLSPCFCGYCLSHKVLLTVVQWIGSQISDFISSCQNLLKTYEEVLDLWIVDRIPFVGMIVVSLIGIPHIVIFIFLSCCG